MKVQTSVKLICKDCYFVRRGKKLYMRYAFNFAQYIINDDRCGVNPRHKRR